MLLSTLGPLSDMELAGEIALTQWEIVIETAGAVPKEERGAEARRLEGSASILDRYAGRLLRQWIEDER